MMGTKSCLPNSFWSFDPLSPASHIVEKDALPVRSPREWRPESGESPTPQEGGIQEVWMLGCKMERRCQAKGVAWGTKGGMDIETHFLCVFSPLPFSENYQLLLEIQIQKDPNQM